MDSTYRLTMESRFHNCIHQTSMIEKSDGLYCDKCNVMIISFVGTDLQSIRKLMIDQAEEFVNEMIMHTRWSYWFTDRAEYREGKKKLMYVLDTLPDNPFVIVMEREIRKLIKEIGDPNRFSAGYMTFNIMSRECKEFLFKTYRKKY